eukprot:CAMPEP_0114991270 /NCGR_PEP_ID=MMETSP0216-20121206/11270_1 /TAXON_ID=223996 /ORGANISM="Protocruzia adherens, Strain Boccale" /LENGTH=257 /DNA_ID=CAMNT_0002354561 /DNA_START=575 /DNA_END=1348 /DNA_ORIENTATION=-
MTYPRAIIVYFAAAFLIRVSAKRFKNSATNLRIRIDKMKETVKSAQSDFINNMGDELCALLKSHANNQEEELSDKCTRLEFEKKFSEYQLGNYRRYVQNLGEFNWCNFCSDQSNLTFYHQVVKAKKEMSKHGEIQSSETAECMLQESLEFDFLRKRCPNYCGVRFWKHAMDSSCRFNAQNDRINKIRKDAMKERTFNGGDLEETSSNSGKRVATEEPSSKTMEEDDGFDPGQKMQPMASQDDRQTPERKVQRANSLE